MNHEQQAALDAWRAARSVFHAAGGFNNPNTREFRRLQQAVFNALLRCQQLGITEWQRQAALREHTAVR